MSDLDAYIVRRSKDAGETGELAAVIPMPETAPLADETLAVAVIQSEDTGKRDALRAEVRRAIDRAVEIDDLQHVDGREIGGLFRRAIQSDMRLSLAWRQMAVAGSMLAARGASARLADAPDPGELATMSPLVEALAWRQYVVAVRSIAVLTGAEI